MREVPCWVVQVLSSQMAPADGRVGRSTTGGEALGDMVNAIVSARVPARVGVTVATIWLGAWVVATVGVCVSLEDGLGYRFMSTFSMVGLLFTGPLLFIGVDSWGRLATTKTPTDDTRILSVGKERVTIPGIPLLIADEGNARKGTVGFGRGGRHRGCEWWRSWLNRISFTLLRVSSSA